MDQEFINLKELVEMQSDASSTPSPKGAADYKKKKLRVDTNTPKVQGNKKTDSAVSRTDKGPSKRDSRLVDSKPKTPGSKHQRKTSK